jgi:hypothetical protein
MSASANVLTGFNQVVSEFVDTHVLQTVVNFISKEKGVSVTVDELRSALQLTVVTPAPSPMRMPMVGVHPPSLSNFVPTAVQPGRGSKKAQPQPGAVLCQYVFSKGNNKDKTCGEVNGEVAVEGSDKCKNHIDKGPKKTKATKDAPANTQRAADTAKAPPVNTRSDQGQLEVYPYVNRPGFFKTKQHGFIVQQRDGDGDGDGGFIVATGIDDGGQVRPLTDDEKKIAYDLGIGIIDPKVESAKSNVPTATTKPLAIPTLPSVGAPSPSNGSKVATVPSVPTVPSIPSVPSVPSVPGIPKITPLVPPGGLVIPKI